MSAITCTPTPCSTPTASEIPEGILDAAVTVADRDARPARRRHASRNSRAGSIYIVKPKMHGPDEVALRRRAVRRASRTCSACRATRSRWASWTRSGAPRVNLKACIRAARDRVVFINTGFLDRTGDEIHTSMEAGPMIRKDDMQGHAWIKAYEDQQRRYRPGLRPARPGADRQGHVGDARPDGRHAGAEDRPSEGRRQHRLGALADRRDAARAALSPGRRRRRGRRSWRAARARRSTTS